MNDGKNIGLLTAAILMVSFLFFSTLSFAKVEGIAVTAGTDQTGTSASAGTDPAAGGQVTALTLTASSQTNQWQGYFGQLTGTVILEDNSNNQLYNWTISTVAGSLFVTNASSVTWASIQTHQNCGTTGGLDFYTSSSATNDKVSNTFTNGTFAALTVGTVRLGDGAGGEGTCTVDLFGTAGASSTWEENILNDTSGQVWQVFLRNNQAGFNSTNMDFEMIVPEDNAGNSATKTYNFYAELS